MRGDREKQWNALMRPENRANSGMSPSCAGLILTSMVSVI
jgi:hypothetical protein